MTIETAVTDAPAQIELSEIDKTFGDGETSVHVLRAVSLRIEAGEALAIVGPSGCGKSTLLNIIGALIRPTSGAVRFEGRDLGALDDRALAAFRNQRIGFVFQSHHLLPQCTAIENVVIPTLVHPDPGVRRSAIDRAADLLKRVGLADRADHRPAQMSGGECQRVAVARALINEPAVILADEPTGSLDEESAAHLADLLVDVNSDRGVTLLAVTHSVALAGRMRRGLALRHGRVEPWTGDA